MLDLLFILCGWHGEILNLRLSIGYGYFADVLTAYACIVYLLFIHWMANLTIYISAQLYSSLSEITAGRGVVAELD